jgi:ubiquinone biosynthesis protein
MSRWREILSILRKYGLAKWISGIDFDFGRALFGSRNGEAMSQLSHEVRVRMAIEELGPTFIKLGQILSTRPDLVGLPLADELRQLQTNVPADDFATVKDLIELELARPLAECYASFCEVPLASGSIGQVHAARLHTGEEVVVKVQHANIEQRVRIDLEMIHGLAQMAEMWPKLALYRPTKVVEEFRRTLRRELDFDRELRNLQLFGDQFKGNATVHIPSVYDHLSSGRVLTMERLEGIKLSELPPEDTADCAFDRQELAWRGAKLYLEMIFTRGHFHADPHPGNLVMMNGNVIGLLDFGMIGRIDPWLREQMEDLLLAILERDATSVSAIIMRLGATPPNLDESMLMIDAAEFVDHYGSQPIEAFDLGGALTEMIELIRRYRIVLPSPLAMLLKVMIMLEGTGRMLCPKFSLMEVMQPYRKRMLIRRLSPQRQWVKLRRLMHDSEQLIQELPRRLIDILQQVQSGRFDVHLDHRGLEPSVNRLVLGMLASALFLGSSILLSRDVKPLAFGISILGLGGCLISLGLGLRLLRAISKSGHLDRKKK